MKEDKNIQNSYIIDNQYRIIKVHSNWDKFAKDNYGDISIMERNIIGKSIMEYIKGDSVKMWYESIIELAKNLKINITRPYRCDSPSKKRFMEMEIIPLENGNILINHYLIREEEMRESENKPFSFNFTDERNIITRCSICNRFLHKNRWIELEEAIKHFDFRVIQITDIICNDCIRRELADTDK